MQTIKPNKLVQPFSALIDKYGRSGLVSSILNREATACGLTKPGDLKVISNRLGWVDVFEQMLEEKDRFEQFVASIQKDNICHLLILGMGGSSLAPEMYGQIFGCKSFLKSYQIVDTTSPTAIEKIDHDIDFTRALLIVASKSGTTVETISQFRHFYKIVKEKRPLKVGRYFAAITDQGSALYNIGQRNRFREMFINRSDIGGRYSALSYFGLVPALFTRLNISKFLHEAQVQAGVMQSQSDRCDALKLGLVLGLAAKSGMNKLKFYASPRLRPFVAWLEQLIAESTGKNGLGLIPVDDDYDCPGIWQPDWVIVNMTTGNDQSKKAPDSQRNNTTDNPIINIALPDLDSLGGEILKWEMATVIAARVMGVNPFDEPNVTESKKNSMALLTAKKKRGRRGKPVPDPVLVKGKIDIVSVSDSGLDLRRDRGKSQQEMLNIFLERVAKSDYLAILAFIERSTEVEKKMAILRSSICRKFNITVVRGYGPRYLHSTGQLFKGGPQIGHFLILQQEFDRAVEIPRSDFNFTELIRSQAKGDIKALQKRKRPLININLGSDPVSGLHHLSALI